MQEDDRRVVLRADRLLELHVHLIDHDIARHAEGLGEIGAQLLPFREIDMKGAAADEEAALLLERERLFRLLNVAQLLPANRPAAKERAERHRERGARMGRNVSMILPPSVRQLAASGTFSGR